MLVTGFPGSDDVFDTVVILGMVMLLLILDGGGEPGYASDTLIFGLKKGNNLSASTRLLPVSAR